MTDDRTDDELRAEAKRRADQIEAQTAADLIAGAKRRRQPPTMLWAALLALAVTGCVAIVAITSDPNPPPTNQREACPATMPAGEFTECLTRRIERQQRAHCDRLRAKPANQLTDADWRNLSRC